MKPPQRVHYKTIGKQLYLKHKSLKLDVLN